MPELPEVESTRRHLEGPLVGRTVTKVEVGRPRMIRHQARAADFRDRLVGRKLHELDRHGKFMLGRLEGDITLIMHLGMSGRMQLADVGDERPPHSNVVLAFDDEIELRLVDPRTFGFMVAVTPEEYDSMSVAALGPDALTALPPRREMIRFLADRTAPIKTLLLDQRFVAGLGNIYADEVLHRSQIAGARHGGSLTPEEVGRVRSAIGPVLRAGLKAGGTSLDDLAYLLPDGRAGEFVAQLQVYGREGESCRRCGAAIRRQVIAQRSHFSCPECQT